MTAAYQALYGPSPRLTGLSFARCNVEVREQMNSSALEGIRRVLRGQRAEQVDAQVLHLLREGSQGRRRDGEKTTQACDSVRPKLRGKEVWTSQKPYHQYRTATSN